MRGIGLYPVYDELFAVKAIVLLRIFNEKRVAEYRFGRVFPLLVIKSVNAAKVGYAAFGRYSGSAEENNIVAIVYPLIEL